MCQRVERVEHERRTQLFGTFSQLSQRGDCQTQVGLGAGIGRIGCDGLPKPLYGLCVVTLSQQQTCQAAMGPAAMIVEFQGGL